MKSLLILQKLSKLGKTLSRIVFIFSVIGFVGCIAGLLSLVFGNDSLIRIGGVTVHGPISSDAGENVVSIAGALAGWLIVCAGEAVLAKFAEAYFKNALKAQTPFTVDGARELQRLGILALAIPTGCAAIGTIVEGIIAGFAKTPKSALFMGSDAGILLGIMMIVGALLCRCGAEMHERG